MFVFVENNYTHTISQSMNGLLEAAVLVSVCVSVSILGGYLSETANGISLAKNTHHQRTVRVTYRNCRMLARKGLECWGYIPCFWNVSGFWLDSLRTFLHPWNARFLHSGSCSAQRLTRRRFASSIRQQACIREHITLPKSQIMHTSYFYLVTPRRYLLH